MAIQHDCYETVLRRLLWQSLVYNSIECAKILLTTTKIIDNSYSGRNRGCPRIDTIEFAVQNGIDLDLIIVLSKNTKLYSILHEKGYECLPGKYIPNRKNKKLLHIYYSKRWQLMCKMASILRQQGRTKQYCQGIHAPNTTCYN